MKPRALVLVGYGINCDRETEYAFNSNGALAERVDINDLIDKKYKLEDYQILAFPGGFSYGDYIASGKALANKVMTNLHDDVLEFIAGGKLVIGICNGFQVMVKAGLVPAFKNYDVQEATLTYNKSGKYEDRWIHLKKVSDKCVFTKGVDQIYLPVAHGEGNFQAPPEIIEKLENQEQVVFKYCDTYGDLADGKFPLNPNNAMNDIAGICDPTGRVFGMMPHPERYLNFTNNPNWTREKEKLKREGKPIPERGPGNLIFKNAVEYAEINLI